jgi:lipoyl(octanoyl) transferase
MCSAKKGPQMTEIEWIHSPQLVPYEEAVTFMEKRVAAIREKQAPSAVWLLEHPPLYTAGTSYKKDDLMDKRLPVYEKGRGGQHTYHGPGQRVGYVMLDLREHGQDLRAYINKLEQWLIDTLADFDVIGERRCGRVGIWVDMARYGALPGRENKIAAIGVRIRHWIAYHGVALNVAPDLSHFGGIVPCGIREHGVTSLKALGIDASMNDVDATLKKTWEKVFNSDYQPGKICAA